MRNFLAGLALVALGLVVLKLNQRFRALRCSWCARPYAFWRRAGGRACREDKNLMDKMARARIDTRPYFPPVQPNPAGRKP